MRSKWLVAILVVIAAVACHNRETPISGAYGANVLQGQVVMAGSLAGAPVEGTEVTVLGTGLTTRVGPDGHFFFAGVPSSVDLRVSRGDGVDVTYKLDTTSSKPVVVRVDGNAAGRRRAAGHHDQYEGLIKAISAISITVTDSHRGEVTLAIDAQTTIRKGGQSLTPLDLQVGQRVHVVGRTDDHNNLVAASIVLEDENAGDDGAQDQTPTTTANGTVASVGSSQLVVHRHKGDDVTVKVDDKTLIVRQGYKISLTDVRVGDRIEAEGKQVDANTILATKIQIEPGPNDGHH